MDSICLENNLALFIVVEYDIPYSPARYTLKRSPCPRVPGGKMSKRAKRALQRDGHNPDVPHRMHVTLRFIRAVGCGAAVNMDDLQPQTTTWPSLRNTMSSEHSKFQKTLCGTILFIKFKPTVKPYSVGMYTMAVGLLKSETQGQPVIQQRGQRCGDGGSVRRTVWVIRVCK